MQYIPYNSALLAQDTLFLTQKGTVFANLQKFWDLGRTPPHVGKNSQIISFFYESVPYVQSYEELVLFLLSHD